MPVISANRGWGEVPWSRTVMMRTALVRCNLQVHVVPCGLQSQVPNSRVFANSKQSGAADRHRKGDF